MREEEAMNRKLEEKKREFLREYKKVLKKSFNEGTGISLLRLRLKGFYASDMKLRSEDLCVLGQLLNGGEAIKELDLSLNL